jgi:hypothetical protein
MNIPSQHKQQWLLWFFKNCHFKFERIEGW